jgi:hypothetical protein
MSVTTFEGVIENGRVRLPEGVVIPEKQTVFVVVPDPVQPMTRTIPSVRLADPDDAAKFEMKVTWEDVR